MENKTNFITEIYNNFDESITAQEELPEIVCDAFEKVKVKMAESLKEGTARMMKKLQDDLVKIIEEHKDVTCRDFEGKTADFQTLGDYLDTCNNGISTTLCIDISLTHSRRLPEGSRGGGVD